MLGTGTVADIVMTFGTLAMWFIPWGYVIDSLRMGIAWSQFGGTSDRASDPFFYWFMISAFAFIGIMSGVILFPLIVAKVWP